MAGYAEACPWRNTGARSLRAHETKTRELMKKLAILLILVLASACQSSTPIPITPAGGDQADRPRFPRVLDLGTAVLTLHEPQVESHKEYREVTVWTAAVHQPKFGGKRTVGALKITADTLYALIVSLVALGDLTAAEPVVRKLEADYPASPLGRRARQLVSGR